MASTEMSLITIRLGNSSTLGGSSPSIREVAKFLGVQMRDVDESFGLVPIDANGSFAVRVRADKISSNESTLFEGPFSDPEISPFNCKSDSGSSGD